MCSKDNHELIYPKSLSINTAKATKSITLAAMINTKQPAPKIKSPKNEKNGSFTALPTASTSPTSVSTATEPYIIATVSSSLVTVTGFNIDVTIKALITLTGTAVKI